MEKLKKLLDEVKGETFTITKAKNGEKLQQTQSNRLKSRILEALAGDIADEVTPYIYRTEKGFMIEIENGSVADGITNEDGSGAITILVDCVVKGLDCNAQVEGECYADKQAEKAKVAAEKAEAKKRKIEADAKARAIKKAKAEEDE